MSMKAAEPDKLSKRISSYKTNDVHSDELDVFDAAGYFSGYNQGNHTQKRWGMLEGGRRISLDLPMRCSEPIHRHLDVEETIKERICNVKHKQPSSPGGRIASFLNSLFHQVGSKKNKSKSKSKTTSGQDREEESPGGWMRRRRRSSISHFLSSNTSNSTTTSSSSSKSLFSSSGSGFRTPPPYLNTPTKNYKQFLNYSKGVVEEKRNSKEMFWLDEKLKVMESHSEKKRVWVDHDDGHDNDDGVESDSSSDLFELQNYELSRGGLPVYETTNVANINPI